MGMKHYDWGDRRYPCRWLAESNGTGFWMPDRQEIITQFFTRYLFFALAVLYFSSMESVAELLFGLEWVLFAQVVYFLITSWFFHLALKEVTLKTIRFTMAADLLNVALCLIHDPYPIPPAAMGFLMVLLGNGLRYGMRIFSEVLGGAVFCMAFCFALRYRLGGFPINAGVVFFGIFWVTLAVYAYILMGRIERQRHQLDFRSRYDALTGLLNRHGVIAAAEHILRGDATEMAATVLFADLDNFKAVNDRYGHNVGDRVLVEFGQIFCESAEVGVCGRWGGDEFVALLPLRDEATIDKIFDRINSRMEAWSKGNGLPMAVSLGVSHAPRDGCDLMTLLSSADIHLYQSKTRQSPPFALRSRLGPLVGNPETS
ncbi:MAG: GGDEF domain-containing protein [Deltaproteobacteria bacterium]|nr:GGDEF domain-containing protein [Deltaproteobacteria bacterium]